MAFEPCIIGTCEKCGYFVYEDDMYASKGSQPETYICYACDLEEVCDDGSKNL